MHVKKQNLAAITLATSTALGILFMPMTAHADLAGNIGIHSKYLLRGIAEENTGAAVQGGLDYTRKEDGFYVSWWFSSLSYSYERNSTGATNTSTDGKTNTNGFENDISLGYRGEISKDIGYDVSLLQYAYVNVDDSDLLEFTGKLTYSDFYVGVQYLLTDGYWGNSGDGYWKLGYATKLPQDFGLAFDYGYYTYDKSDNAELVTLLGGGSTTSSSGFRHLNVTLSHPIAKTGANMYVQYTFAGEDRTGTEYNDSMVAGITYGF